MFWLRNRRPQDWRDKVEREHRDAPRSVAEVDAAGKRARILALAASADDAPAHDDAGSRPPLGKCIVAEAVVHILDRQVGVTKKPDGRRLSGTTLRRSVIERWRRS